MEVAIHAVTYSHELPACKPDLQPVDLLLETGQGLEDLQYLEVLADDGVLDRARDQVEAAEPVH